MKYFVALCSLTALVCVLLCSTEAAVYREMCPKNMTVEQCKTWVQEKHKSMKECVRHELLGTSVEWADCGSVFCGENTREVPADLSKPYPDCCPTCEVIDPTKPASSSAVGK